MKLRGIDTVTSFAAVLVILMAARPSGVSGGPEETAEPGWQRHREMVQAIAYRVRHPERRDRITGHLSDEEMRAKAAEIAKDLAADLKRSTLNVHAQSNTIDLLAELGELAAGVTPTLVEVLHANDDAAGPGIAYFCSVTKAMSAIAPRDPRVVRALTDTLEQDRSVGSVCHTCGCALEALAVAGPAAAPVAGPVLEKLSRRRLLTTYSDQLGKAIEALGAGSGMIPSLLARAADAQILPEDRAASLRALAKSFGQLTPEEKAAFTSAAASLLAHEDVAMRVAAAEVLGVAGARAVNGLERALQDPHYTVRASAARSLARLGPEATPLIGPLVAALDPFLGTGEAAAEALVAIGPSALPEGERRARSAPPQVRPLAEATVRAVQARDMAPVRDALARRYGHGPGNVGYTYLEMLGEGSGEPYADEHRIHVRVHGGPYDPAGQGPRTINDKLKAVSPPNAFFAALVGRRAGDRLKLILSPETAQSPYLSTERWIDHEVQHLLPMGAGAAFEVEVTRVCAPVIWTVFRGNGFFSPLQIELYCR